MTAAAGSESEVLMMIGLGIPRELWKVQSAVAQIIAWSRFFRQKSAAIELAGMQAD